MLSEGVLFDLCEAGNININMSVIIRHLVNLLREYQTDDGVINDGHVMATFQLFTKVVKLTQNDPVQVERLLKTWNLSRYISEIGSKSVATGRQLLELHAQILNVW